MRRLSNAWVFSDPKHAALYFDKCHFLAPALDDETVQQFCEIAGKKLVAPFDDMRFISRLDDRLFVLGTAACAGQKAGVEAVLREVGSRSLFDIEFSGVSEKEVQAGLAMAYCELAVQCGISGPGAFIRPSEWAAAVLDTLTSDQSDAPALTLTRIKLVDTKELPWELILDLRRDTDSMRKLSRLRNFLAAGSDGWTDTRVAADIEGRIYDYGIAAKKHGLDLKDSALKLFLGTTGWAAASAMFSTLTDQPLAALLAAGPLLVSVGAAALEFRQDRRNIEFLKESSPVSYVIGLRDVAASTRGPLIGVAAKSAS